MENHNELSDIVLEKNSGDKNQKLKKILLISAILILLFLAVIIIMRAINQPDDTAQIALPPEPQTSTVINTNEDKLFQQVPIIKEEPRDSFEEVVKKLKEREEAQPEPIKELETPTAQQPTQPPVVDQKPVVEQAKPAPATTTPKAQTTTPKATPTTTAKPVQKSVNGVSAGTYIQVSSVAKANPDAKFIKAITDKSYPYALYKTEVSGQLVTKVLIGPYESATEARDALVKIKSDLAPSAFIFRVK